jgi:hypothetical protein
VLGYASAGTAAVQSTTQPATGSTATVSTTWGSPGTGATVDYYLDNGEELKPVRSFVRIGEHDGTTSSDHNGMMRAVSYMELTGTSPVDQFTLDLKSINTFPLPVPQSVDALANDIVGTPPFQGIPAKYQPSRRDNFYKGMLMKCWVGTATVGGRLPFVAAQEAGVDNFKLETGNVQELLPPVERVPISMTGKKASPTAGYSDLLENDPATAAATTQNVISAQEVVNAKAFSKAGVSRTLETRVIQASFRQIDYVPRKSGGCFVDGDVEVRATLSTAARSAYVAATATAQAYHTSTLAYDGKSGGSFSVGQQVVFSDGTTRTVKSVDATCAAPGTTAADTICVMGDYLDPTTIGAVDRAVLGLKKTTTIAAVGCQDEVPGYPAVVRLESPFSRPLDPDTLCYI